MLTPRKAAFIAAYTAEPNATKAAITAGYSEATAYSQGSRLLKDVEVQQGLQQANATAIQRVTESLEDAAGSAVWIVEKAVEIVERAMTPLPVYYRGEPTTEMQFAGGTAVAALALLAKRHPEFRDATINVDARTLNVTTRGKLSG